MENLTTEVLVLGAGPGGYTAAFRAADLGKKVVLVDSGAALGGVCLNVGCIPSKALLHAARVIAETREMSENGVSFGPPSIDLDRLRAWKDGVVARLTGGLATLARQRTVTTVRGYGRFTSPHELAVELAGGGAVSVGFGHAIIAVGSEAITLPFIPASDPRVIDSTGALEVEEVPGRLLVIGGGIIGLEMATVYHELGARITVVELLDQLIPGTDRDVVAPLAKRAGRLYENVYLKTRVTAVRAEGAGHRHLRPDPGGGRAPPQRFIDRGRTGRCHRGSGRLHPGEQADADQRAAHLRDRGRGRPADAGAQGHARGQGRRRGHRGQEQLLRRPCHPVGGLHRPRGGLGRGDRERGQGGGRGVRQGRVPVGRQRPLAHPGAFGGDDQGAVRRGDRPDHRLRHHRALGRRPHRRGGAGHRDGRRRGRHRPDHPPAPHPVRDRGHGGRGVRGHDHRPVPAPAPGNGCFVTGDRRRFPAR
jgi:hypothetical protein